MAVRIYFALLAHLLKHPDMDSELSVRHSSGLNYPVGNWDWYSPGRPHFNLWISYSGTGVLTVDGEKFDVSPGFALLLHPEDSAHGRKPGDVAFCNTALHFVAGDSLRKEASLDRFRLRPTQLRHLSVIYELMRYLENLFTAAGAAAVPECDALGAQVLKIFIRDWELGPEEPVDARIRRQSETVRKHPERVWTVSRMAEGAGLSVSQFTRRFSKLFHTSPNVFLIQARIRKARDLLRESTLSVSEISDILGYRDVAFFSRQFKAMAGVSPKAFRLHSFGRE